MFYFRGCFRIFTPAYISFFVFMNMINLIYLSGWDIFHAITYTINYHRPHSWYIGHLWSLLLAEQFYLLWPAVILFLKPRTPIWSAVEVIPLAPILRTRFFNLWSKTRSRFGETFHSVADTLAVGCVLAGNRTFGRLNERYLNLLKCRWFILIPRAVPILNSSLQHPRVAIWTTETILNISTAVCIDGFYIVLNDRSESS
jgi:peptidoglycan/LPS O-acetylase OafA/YrhL